MQFLGDYRIDDYITFGAQLHRFSSGAVYAPTGNVTYTFYENNSTTGAPTGGNLAQLNSKTGLYTARVQLTTANGFEAGKEYLIHLEATVDSVAAAELLMFRIIGNPKVDVDTIKTQAVTCAAGVTVLASVGTSATSTAQTGDAYARLGTPAGASIAADLLTIDNLVDDLESRIGTPSDLGSGATVAANLVDIEGQTDDIGAAGAGLTALASAADLATVAGYIDTEIATLVTEVGKIPKSDGTSSWNATALAAIQSEAQDAITASALATAAELAKVPKSDSTVTWNATALAAIQSEANDAIVAASLPTAAQVKTAIEAAGSHLALILEDTGTTLPAAIGDVPTTGENAAALLASIVEAQGSYTLQQALSIILAVLAGVTADNGATLKSPNGTATRVAATIDANKNRTAMTLTPSA